MQSVDGSALGAARVGRLHRASTPARLLAAMLAGLGLAACAGPSPKVQVATADASQSATASSEAAGQATANESAAAAATEESKPDSTEATASGNAAPPVETADNATPPAPPSTPSTEPQATDPAPAAPAVAATDAPPAEAPQTAAAPQSEPPQTADNAGGVPSPGSGLATGRPYVVIRFAESNTDYEKALSEAVKRALARKPNLAFNLVAVTPRAGTAEELAELTDQAHAEAAAVMKSLSALGIGPERVSMMTWTGQPTDVNEIRLYIR
jgi:hypothetical protein